MASGMERREKPISFFFYRHITTFPSNLDAIALPLDTAHIPDSKQR